MFIPLRGKILVEILKNKKITKSGLIIAENIKEIPHKGRIISLGKPCLDKNGKEVKIYYKENDIVYFKRKWESPKNDNEKEMLILKDEDIVAYEDEQGIHAVKDEIIIKRHYEGKIGSSSLIIPENIGIRSNHEDFYGLVISVGKDSRMSINIGDKILYHRNEGVQIKIDDQDEIFSIKRRAILAKFS